jgi:ankyrin repeat protein/nucleoside phosphorylase
VITLTLNFLFARITSKFTAPLKLRMKRRRACIHDFTVGWLCALPIEVTAAKEALDEEYERIDDAAHYTLGRVGVHKVVVGCLPAGQLGTSSAAAAAVDMQRTFPALQLGLMVGIAGGAPSCRADVRLGDVAISHPQGQCGGVVQYDFGKTLSNGQLIPNGCLNSPNAILLRAVAMMRANINAGRSYIHSHLSFLNQHGLFDRPASDTDVLFESAYDHVGGNACDQCLREKAVERVLRPSQEIVVHFGTIASGNQVIRDGLTRDRLSTAYGGVLCFEMEAAGLMNIFPCLIIRGICDYADSHKNKCWQPFAAAAAAACAKEVLSYVPTSQRSLDRQSIIPNDFLHSEPEQPQLTESWSIKRNPCSAMQNGFDPSSLYTKSSLTQDQRQEYHQSLKFSQIDARHAIIQDAHSQTCRWLLEISEYQDWLAPDKMLEHHGFLWIKGNPGTGKSTIMKFALASTKKETTNDIVIKFFFNARGDDLEKSVLGMYRSLLFQLLEELPDLQHVFALLPPRLSDDDTTYEWDLKNLQSLFGHAVERLGHRSLICFIDALDECEEVQVREMIEFFEYLGDYAVSSQVRLRTCFSSRHYPHISIEHGISLVLEDQEGHKDDIATYVNSKLKGRGSKIFDEVRSSICERSSGIFLWVVLVVQMMKKPFDNGQIQVLKKRLNEIPDGLEELFDDILTRDAENMEIMILCLQWLLFARRPLGPVELFYAVSIGIEPDSITDLDSADIDQESLQYFVSSSSKGLAEVTKVERKTVQFIHESVRDYLLKTHRIQRIRADLASNFYGSSHEILKKCCQSYISFALSWNPNWKTLEKSSDTACVVNKRQIDPEDYPFLKYSVHNVLYHSDMAAEYGVEQSAFVADYPYKDWALLNNLFARGVNGTYSCSVSPLYIFANEGVSNLINIEVENVSLIDIQGEYYRFPLRAVLAHADEGALDALLAPHLDVLHSRDALKITPQERQAAIKEVLTKSEEFTLPKDQTLLSWAAENGKTDLAKILLGTRKVDAECKSYLNQTPLSLAARNGHAAVVKLLIDTGEVDINFKSCHNQTPLILAARNGHVAVVKLLLETGRADAEFKDENGRTCLSYAAEEGYLNVATLLIETGKVNVESVDQYSRRLLFDAVQRGYSNMVKLLLETGKGDIEYEDENGRTPLSYAARKGDSHMVKLLLETGKANVESKDINGVTPLSYATRQGDLDIVKLLLETGKANVESKDIHGVTPLSYAIRQGDLDMVKVIFRIGQANVESKDICGRTPLSNAALFGHLDIAKLLLETGQADVESKDIYGRTSLSNAALCGHLDIVKLLLEIGKADVESQDGWGWTSLSHAAANGHFGSAKLIFDSWMVALTSKEKTYNIERLGLDKACAFCRTPLHEAVEQGAVEVVRFLVSTIKVDLNTVDWLGRTALDLAQENGFIEMIEILQQAQCDRYAQLSKGNMEEVVNQDEVPSFSLHQ